MTFLNPLLLAGLFLAAIPFVIHLFNFRRPRKVDFSSLEFIRELKKTTMQKVRIKQWLLLLLRTLALVCLILVFARPTLDARLASTVGADARTSVGIVLDNSPSMGIRNADGGYLEQAQKLALTLANRLESGDDLTLHSTSGGDPVTYYSAVSSVAAIEAVEISDTRIPLLRALQEVATTLHESDNVNRELYIITDGQRSTIGDTTGTGAPADRVNGYALQIGSRAPDNVGIVDVAVKSRIIETGQPIHVGATVRNFGNTDVENYVVSAYLDDARVAQTSINIPSGGAAEADLTITPTARGWLAGEVRLEDDAFEPDNVRHFVLHVPEVRRILLVRGQGQSVTYVRTAIEAGRSEGRALFEVDVADEAQIAAANIDNYHITFLVGVADLTSGEINILARFVEDGGGLLVFPGRSASIADYNLLLDELEGGTFEGFVGTEGSSTAVTSLESLEEDHPLFEGIFDPGTDGEVEKPDIFFAVDYQPLRGSEQTLLELGNDKPLLQELKHGNGSTLFFTVLPEPSWSDLPVRGLFVPLLYRSVYYLSSSTASTATGLIAGRDGQVVIAGAVNDDQLHLRNAAAIEFVPVARRVTGGTQLTIPATLNITGVTTVRSDTNVTALVPVNIDASESDLGRLSADELRAMTSVATGVPVRTLDISGFSPEELEAVVTTARTGVELWRPLLLAALLFLIVEMLLARLWRPETGSAGN